jgi:hypothetical protein
MGPCLIAFPHVACRTMPGGPRFSGPLEAPFCPSAPDRPSLGGLPRAGTAAGTAAGCQFGSQLRRAAAYPRQLAELCWWLCGGDVVVMVRGCRPSLPSFNFALPLQISRSILPLLASLLASSSTHSAPSSPERGAVPVPQPAHLRSHRDQPSDL